MSGAVPLLEERAKPKASDARDLITSVAARMMRERGYADMSLRDLAAEVGMKAGSLYYHFASKEELATEVMRLGVEVVSHAVREALAASPELSPRDRLIRAMSVHLDTLQSASDFASAHIRCYALVPSNVRTQLLVVRREYDKLWNQLLRAYLGDSGDATQVRYLRHALIGSMNWSLEWFDPERDSVEAYVSALTRLLPDP